MEKMNFIYFVLGALSLFVGILVQPYVKQAWSAVKSWISPKKMTFTNDKPLGLVQLEVESLQKQVVELKEQMDNVAANSYRREVNRKNNIRREVRDYLSELRSK